MKKKGFIIGGVVFLIIILACLYFMNGESSAKAIKLEMTQTERNSIINTVTATGTVEPVVIVEVGTQVSGIIDKIYVDYNSVVTKGQLLAEMDKVNLQAELISKEAELASAKVEYEYQEKNNARNKALHEKQLISDTEYETVTYNYEKAKSSYDRLRSDMVKVRRNLEYATITSPIDGVVINRAVEEGQTVAAGFSTPTLFTIANDLTQMRVIANVDETDIGPIEEGQKVTFTVDAYPEDLFEGNVTQVRLEATTTSSVVTYEVVISAYNPDLKLKPGLTAYTNIYTLERPNILTIPTRALRFVPDEEQLAALNLSIAPGTIREAPAGKKMVWQKNGQSLESKVVTTGAVSGNDTEILEGLSDNEEIVLRISSNGTLTTTNNVERSPFMPGPPGRDNNKKEKEEE